MNSSDDDDIIETESSTEGEVIQNRENHAEVEDANDSLIVTNDKSESEAKESEQETSTGQEKANKVADGVGATSSKPTKYTGKISRNKNSKTRKKATGRYY